MSDHCPITSVDPGDWAALAAQFRDDNYQQAPAYAAAAARRQHGSSEHLAFRDPGGEVHGLATVRVGRLPLLRAGVAYVAAGPLTRRDDAGDLDRLERCLSGLRREFMQRRGLALRVLAPLGSPEWNAAAGPAFERAGLRPCSRSRSYRTFLLDLGRPLDALLERCSKYWRRNLRRTERTPFAIETGTGAALWKHVVHLHRDLSERKAFLAPLDAVFYASLEQRLDPSQRPLVTVATLDGVARAAIVTSILGDTAVPLVLACDRDATTAYAAYLLQWHSIALAHGHGMRYYDLGGIDPLRNAGVYNFKLGLRGDDRCAPGPFESVPPGPRGAIGLAAERLYRSLAAMPAAGGSR